MNPNSIQTAIFDRLLAYPPLDALLARRKTPSGTVLTDPAIYSHVPQLVDSNDNYPYVVIGDDTSVGFDTDDTTGSESTVTVHVWSRQRGEHECKWIQESIYAALNRHELTPWRRHFVDCVWEYADTTLDPDGITLHGVARFRIITESAEQFAVTNTGTLA